MKDRHEDARKILNRLHSPEEAQVEYVQIEAQMRIDKTLDTSYLHMVKKPSYRKRLWLTLACTGFNQFSGILVITSTLIEILNALLLTVTRLQPNHIQELGLRYLATAPLQLRLADPLAGLCYSWPRPHRPHEKTSPPPTRHRRLYDLPDS